MGQQGGDDQNRCRHHHVLPDASQDRSGLCAKPLATSAKGALGCLGATKTQQPSLSLDKGDPYAEEGAEADKRLPHARVEIYFNEGQHRGRPHVAVVLQDGKVSVSLEDPPVLLTKNGYRGEASALKVVARHRTALRALWDDTRPDDQKLPSR